MKRDAERELIIECAISLNGETKQERETEKEVRLLYRRNGDGGLTHGWRNMLRVILLQPKHPSVATLTSRSVYRSDKLHRCKSRSRDHPAYFLPLSLSLFLSLCVAKRGRRRLKRLPSTDYRMLKALSRTSQPGGNSRINEQSNGSVIRLSKFVDKILPCFVMDLIGSPHRRRYDRGIELWWTNIRVRVLMREQRGERDNSLSLSMNVVTRGSTFIPGKCPRKMTLHNNTLSHTHIHICTRTYIY